jgi:hypothetical protein
VQVAGLAGHLQDLGGVGQAEMAHDDGLEGARFDTAVPVVAGAVAHGHVVPGQPGAAVQQGGLVGLDNQQVVRLFLGDQELGGVGVGVQGIGGDHHPGKVQVVQQRPQRGDLTGSAVDLALGQHGAGGQVHRGQQVDLAALRIGGAAQGLAVDRHGAPAPARAVTVGQPRTDRCGQGLRVQATQGPADGGLGRGDPVVGTSSSPARTPTGSSGSRPARTTCVRRG